MPASNISHNTPAAGSISWTAFNIAYAGQGFPIPAGSTAGRFVWWEYRNGTPAVLTGDVLPDLGADDTVLFINKGGIGQLLPETTIVDGSLIVEESILASAIGADQINGDHIQAGAVEAEHIAAGTITANELSVGTVSSNLVANGSFEDVDADGMIIGWGVTTMSNGTITPVTGVASSGSVAIEFNATSTAGNLRLAQAPSKYIPVSSASARKWYVSARMGVSTATTKGATIRCIWYTAAKGFISSTDVLADAALTTAFSVYEGQATPPSTARYMRIELILSAPNVATKMYVDEVTVMEVLMSAHIGDGQVSATKIKGDAIDGKTITGAIVRTAASGARVQIDSVGLRAFNSSGVETVKISATDGTFTGTGDFTATNTKGLVALTPSTQTGGGRPGVLLGADSSTIYGPMLFGADPTKTHTDGFEAGDAALVSGQAKTGSVRSQLVLKQDGEIRLQAQGGTLNGQGFYLDANGATISAPNVAITGNINGNLAQHQRAEFTTSLFYVAGGQQWDSGPVTADTSSTARTMNNDFCTVGPYSGSISFTKAGFYSVSLFIVPRGTPGMGWAALAHSGTGERLVQAGNSTAMWETYLQTIPVYFWAGDYVRSTLVYATGHNIDARWKIVKHPY